MAKKMLEIDVYNGLDNDGIYSAVYLGETDDDPIEVKTTWDEVIAAEIEMHCVPFDGPFTVGNGHDSVQDIMRVAQNLRNAADKMDAAVNERGILLRDELMAEAQKNNVAYSDIDREKYTVDYAGYLNYIMEK